MFRYQLFDAFKIARADFAGGQQVGHQRGDIAIEEPLGKLGDHRTLNFRFGDQRSIDELAGSGPVGDDTPALQPRK